MGSCLGPARPGFEAWVAYLLHLLLLHRLRIATLHASRHATLHGHAHLRRTWLGLELELE